EPEQLEGIIKESLEEVGISPNKVNLSVSGPDVIVRFIDFPKMTEEQLEDALVYEAEKYIPFNLSEVITDFIILGDAQESGQMKVILAAAKKSMVLPMLEVIKQVGMEVEVVDVDSFALFNAFFYANPLVENKCYALLDFGHSRTNVLISDGKAPCFIRQIQIGGKNIDESLIRDLSLSLEESEKCKLGLSELDKDAIMKSTTPILDSLLKELQLSFTYFENRTNKKIEEIYCCGGMIEQERVFEYLNENLGIQMKKWNLFNSIGFSGNLSQEDVHSVSSQLVVSLGLALRG
ncbi:MAG: pilus assembly protein PilM, partial [Candidatus Omnitrophica bacterium]|nr:pilus assembly protein PilM [Candidatus Omnitrophota bacterium]